MSRSAPDSAEIQKYLESLPEAEVAAIFEKVVFKVKRRWEFWLGVFLFAVWWIVWIVIASSFGLVWGIVGTLLAFLIAAGLLWPFVRWVNTRVLRDEVTSRLPANGV